MATPRLLSLLPVALGGLVLTTTPMVGMSVNDLQALNRELGRLCSDPPRQAIAVCRIHARLVRAM
ncbi:hypothetical protein LBMAG39_01830 [Cyanobium sp.]|nr:hypothetical protein LBMAG39_01830 [Cyanobium sp.]